MGNISKINLIPHLIFDKEENSTMFDINYGKIQGENGHAKMDNFRVQVIDNCHWYNRNSYQYPVPKV